MREKKKLAESGFTSEICIFEQNEVGISSLPSSNEDLTNQVFSETQSDSQDNDGTSPNPNTIVLEWWTTYNVDL